VPYSRPHAGWPLFPHHSMFAVAARNRYVDVVDELLFSVFVFKSFGPVVLGTDKCSEFGYSEHVVEVVDVVVVDLRVSVVVHGI
jgi:hypothetical protein